MHTAQHKPSAEGERLTHVADEMLDGEAAGNESKQARYERAKRTLKQAYDTLIVTKKPHTPDCTMRFYRHHRVHSVLSFKPVSL